MLGPDFTAGHHLQVGNREAHSSLSACTSCPYWSPFLLRPFTLCYLSIWLPTYLAAYSSIHLTYFHSLPHPLSSPSHPSSPMPSAHCARRLLESHHFRVRQLGSVRWGSSSRLWLSRHAIWDHSRTQRLFPESMGSDPGLRKGRCRYLSDEWEGTMEWQLGPSSAFIYIDG